MRRAALVLLAGCGGSSTVAIPEPITLEFGPYELAPGQEIANDCVAATLNNDEPLYVTAVELTTGIGFHHSNWFWVPDNRFQGPDGTFRCSDRDYDEATVGIVGGVLFAQSTQATHEIQAFGPDTAIVVPPRSRVIAGIHLLNPSDEPRSLDLSLTITPSEEPATLLAAMALTNESIALPPRRKSRFTVLCDIEATHQDILSRPVDFGVYYALPHYHDLGRGITLTAIRPDDTEVAIFETTATIGDALGKTMTPAFTMAGFTKLRFSCNFDNPRDEVVRFGVGDQEMCVLLAFTDSSHTWAGGAITRNTPGTEVDHGDFIEVTHECSLVVAPANR